MICSNCKLPTDETGYHTKTECIEAAQTYISKLQSELTAIQKELALFKNFDTAIGARIGDFFDRCEQLERERDAALARAEAAEEIVEQAKLLCPHDHRDCAGHNNAVAQVINKLLKGQK